MTRRAAFPFMAPIGRTVLADGNAALIEQLAQIVLVEQGERLNRPDFGCQLNNLAFTTGGSELAPAIGALIHSALSKWNDSHFEIVSVDVQAAEGRSNVLITYREQASEGLRQVVISRDVTG